MLFAEEMAKPDAEVCFVKAAGYVAMHRRPDLSRVDDALAEIDELAVELEKLLPPIAEGRFPLRTLKQISRFMFDPVEDGGLGFVGNGSDFYDPRNSCLDEVLATRKGIPITLSLIYMELARRVGVEMVGVNLPGGGVGGGGGGGDDSPETSSEKGTATPKTSITIDRGFFGDQTIRPRQFFTRVLTNLKQVRNCAFPKSRLCVCPYKTDTFLETSTDLLQQGGVLQRAFDRELPAALQPHG